MAPHRPLDVPPRPARFERERGGQGGPLADVAVRRAGRRARGERDRTDEKLRSDGTTHRTIIAKKAKPGAPSAPRADRPGEVAVDTSTATYTAISTPTGDGPHAPSPRVPSYSARRGSRWGGGTERVRERSEGPGAAAAGIETLEHPVHFSTP